MYGLGELKSKTIRSWARAYGEELEVGQSYTEQPSTITIAFTNGAVEPIENSETVNTNKNKIHRLCMIMDAEDFTVFTKAMELHYIDMKAFAKAVNEADSISINDTEEVMFAKWLSIITEKEINNKSIIENACIEEEEIQMAMTALVRQSEDKIIRQAYQRRKDEIYFHKKEIFDYQQKVEQAEIEIERLHRVDSENEKLRQELAELRLQLNSK